MSDCNFCTLKRMRRSRKGTGIRLVLRADPFAGFGSGLAVFEIKPGKKLDISKDSKQRVAWFAELPDRCWC